ncbi:MAG TPA: LacI family DNA-binding transcriptional regulator [Nocardioidaceae bacterium]|nr:LacI family DNA-binding transcriptional regulator [Nocardioidaceae bacterium]
MHDVARLAGVSHQTVSRVLNGHPNVSAATRDRVVAAMQQLNYRPNAFARGLVTRRSHRIGVLSFDSRLFGPGSTLHAIERAARAKGFGVAVAGMSDHAGGDVDDAMEALHAQAVDGIIVIAPNAAAVRTLGVLAPAVPVVALEAEYRDQPVVSIDQLEGARLATQHLLDLGHRTVYHVAGPLDWREAELRVEGWRFALSGAGVPIPPLLHGDWSPRSGYAAGQEIVDRDEVTAVFAGNDQMALGLVHALASRGRRVPEDVSVVGFDDIPEAEFMLPALTTVWQDFDEVGRRGFDLLLALVAKRYSGGNATLNSSHSSADNPDGHATTGENRGRVTIPPQLVVRASTAGQHGGRSRRRQSPRASR